MNVAHQLGIDDDTQGMLAQAAASWPGWTSTHPGLAAVPDLHRLRPWLRRAGPAQGDQVLHELAELAAVDGGDEVAAAATVAWALLPGASSLANKLCGLSPDINQLVASQLWIEIRTRAARPAHKVAANVLMNTRAGVLHECGIRTQLERCDLTQARTRPVDPTDLAAVVGDRSATTMCDQMRAAAELLDVLEWACLHHVITDEDRSLLLCLVRAADQVTTTRLRRGHGGLMSNELTARVGQQLGIAPATVKRRTRRSLAALSTAASARRSAA